MGRKRARKIERRAAQRNRSDRWGLPADPERDLFDHEALFSRIPEWQEDEAVAVKVCGSCIDFIEDGEGGRGTCLHPASGILSPWTDTEGCAYWRRR